MAVIIIVRRVQGGFSARFNLPRRKFGPLGKTTAEAIGLLVQASKVFVPVFDKEDAGTQRYVRKLRSAKKKKK